MKESASAKINFDRYYIEDIEFKLLNPNFQKNRYEVRISFDTKIVLDTENRKSNINIIAKVYDKELNKEEDPFYLKVNLLGYFSYESDLSDEDCKKMMEINGTAILFPYLRNIITNITAASGLPPLIIPTYNIPKLIKNNKEKK